LVWAGLWFLAFILAGCSQKETALVVTEVNPTQTITPILTLSPSPTRATENPATATPTQDKTPPKFPVFSLCSPLEEHDLSSLPGIVSSPYDPPPAAKDDRHQGVDFAYFNQGGRKSIDGEGVRAILPGRVAARVEDRLPYGNMILLETPGAYLPAEVISGLGMGSGESVYHLYAHLLTGPTPDLGDWVACGSPLGQVGASGYNIPVAHLHLETRIGPAGTQFGVMAYYDTLAAAEEMANYELWRMSPIVRHFDPMRLFQADGFHPEMDE
ncbi:MAG: M23 family metallopeptidase, partial [Anaerolineales bacterium]|nr:M23 family metallopeptidase [Anaerolineales bacterium]